MRDPVLCADGSTYERVAIEAWLAAHSTSPVTNLPLPHKQLVPNVFARKLIARRRAAAAEGCGGSGSSVHGGSGTSRS